jgi:hypothetical protein
MRIVICGSVSFPEKMREAGKRLKRMGHDVVIPYGLDKYDIRTHADAESLKKRKDYINMVKEELTIRHFDEIKNGDAILVVNEEKKGIPNYIGGATFAEMMLAFYYKKKIFFMNPIPDHKTFDFFRDEIEAVHPIVINGNIDMIK